ncbi:hypothetical protein V2154_10585 [Ewingella sp. CoE-038-23]|uniref:hypothetical protein n=1 Tax=Ewingella docleensis TaxID=3118588 RepID=UPI0033655564
MTVKEKSYCHLIKSPKEDAFRYIHMRQITCGSDERAMSGIMTIKLNEQIRRMKNFRWK